MMKLKKIDLSMLGLMVVVIGISIIMLVDLSKFESHLAGTVGPGVFPLFILLVVIIMALWNMAKAFSPSKYKLLSPFPSGSAKGLVVSRLAEILSKELQSPVSVVAKIGEGFFSAEYAGAAAEPDGMVLERQRPYGASLTCLSQQKVGFWLMVILSHVQTQSIKKKSDISQVN